MSGTSSTIPGDENQLQTTRKSKVYDVQLHRQNARKTTYEHGRTSNDTSIQLNNDEGQLFHHLLAKLLYLSKCTRQDIQTAVAFLCTRVREPDTNDYKKLTKVMQYLRNTRNVTLTIEPGDEPKWWVDRSQAVHPYMKSHTGIYMTL